MKKYVLITGACGGLGFAATVQLSRAGYNVFACDLKAQADEKLLTLSKRSKSKKSDADAEYKGQVVPIDLDVTSDDSIAKCKETVRQNTSELFAIINLAGIYKMDSLLEGDEQTFRKIVEVNFWGTYKINKAFFDLLKPNGSIIINMSSETAGHSIPPFKAYYSLSKHMVDEYTDALRRELAFFGTKVIKIRGGCFKTDLQTDCQKQFMKMSENTKYYSEQFKAMQKSMSKECSVSNSPYKLADLIVKILQNPEPKIIYRLTNRLKPKLIGAMPEKLQDNIYFNSLTIKVSKQKDEQKNNKQL